MANLSGGGPLPRELVTRKSLENAAAGSGELLLTRALSFGQRGAVTLAIRRARRSANASSSSSGIARLASP